MRVLLPFRIAIESEKAGFHPVRYVLATGLLSASLTTPIKIFALPPLRSKEQFPALPKLFFGSFAIQADSIDSANTNPKRRIENETFY